MRPLLHLLCFAIASSLTAAPAAEFLPGVQRIVFLGDSITYSGEYVDAFEGYLAARFPERQFTVINVGLPSETVSGLSEEGHAGGQFPRPVLRERLDRVLAKTKPDLIFACYGMNDGIYRPFDEERFQHFKDGMLELRAKAAAAGAQIVHLTPFAFDPVPIAQNTVPAESNDPGKPFAGYDEVLTRYASWLVEQRRDGWRVVDIHTRLVTTLAARRATDPAFCFAKDGVHPDAAGHWVAAMELIRELTGQEENLTMSLLNAIRVPRLEPELLPLVRQRGRLLTGAWLNEIGHLRPGMSRGLPLPEAEAAAANLAPQIREAARRVYTF